MNAVVTIENQPTMPAHLREMFGKPMNNELSGGVSSGFPVLSVKGKTWSLTEAGTKTVIMRPGEDEEPAASIEVVIVKANSQLAKVYYENGYSEGSDEKPTCYSNSGVAPEADAAKPQCASCAACPHNVWGSRVTETSGKGKACSDSRRLAVVPSGQLNHLMLLRVPATSLKDLSAYGDMLSRRNGGTPYQAIVTKIGFDPLMAYPKLTFKEVRWLSAAEATEVFETMGSDVVSQILGANSKPLVQPTNVTVGTNSAAASIVSSKVDVVEVPAKPAGRPKKAASPKAEAETGVDTKKASSNAFASSPAPEKPAPAPSKAAAKVPMASDSLEAALAELDDLMA